VEAVSDLVERQARRQQLLARDDAVRRAGKMGERPV
jgi:hypothetical protein